MRHTGRFQLLVGLDFARTSKSVVDDPGSQGFGRKMPQSRPPLIPQPEVRSRFQFEFLRLERNFSFSDFPNECAGIFRILSGTDTTKGSFSSIQNFLIWACSEDLPAPGAPRKTTM